MSVTQPTLIEDPSTKRCLKCKELLPLSAFGKRKNGRNGMQSRCKKCCKEALRPQDHLRRKEYYLENRDSIRPKNNARNRRNAKRIAARGKVYRQQNRERLRIAKAAEYQRNKAKRIAKNREYRLANPEQANEYSRKWRQQNPETRKASVANDKIKRSGKPGFCLPVQWIAKCEFHGWRCYLCGKALTFETAQVEHRIPLSRGGSHWPANLAPACARCNRSKSNRTEVEFRELIGLARMRPAVVLLCIRLGP